MGCVFLGNIKQFSDSPPTKYVFVLLLPEQVLVFSSERLE